MLSNTTLLLPSTNDNVELLLAVKVLISVMLPSAAVSKPLALELNARPLLAAVVRSKLL